MYITSFVLAIKESHPTVGFHPSARAPPHDPSNTIRHMKIGVGYRHESCYFDGGTLKDQLHAGSTINLANQEQYCTFQWKLLHRILVLQPPYEPTQCNLWISLLALFIVVPNSPSRSFQTLCTGCGLRTTVRVIRCPWRRSLGP